MKEQDLIDLGFTKEYGDEDFYYYTLDFGRGFGLISDANDEIKNDNWTISIFEEDSIQFTNKEELELLINVLNRNKI